jgi:membrane protein required for colicin V production
MAITLLDGLLIGLMLVSGVLAMIRGLSRELLSVGSWVGAAAAAYFFYPQLSPYVEDYSRQISESKTLADLGAAAIIFFVTLIVLSLVAMRIADFIVDSRIGALDRTLGFVFGAVRGALLVVVALLFYNWLVPDNQWPWIANAKSKPVLDQIGESIVQMLPEDPEKTFERVVPGLGGEEPGEEPGGETQGETQG